MLIACQPLAMHPKRSPTIAHAEPLGCNTCRSISNLALHIACESLNAPCVRIVERKRGLIFHGMSFHGMGCRSARSERGASMCNMCWACGQALSVSPQTCRTKGAAMCTYWRWFSCTPRQQVHLRIFRQRHSARRIGSYLRFRQRRGGGDERHMIFECPSVQHIRDQNSDLFWDGQSRREFVNQADQVAVMDFIVACFDSFVQTD